MDLDDLLEDLVERARRAGRQALADQRTRKGRGRAAALRASAAVSGVAAATSAGIGAVVLAATESGAGDVIGGAGLVGGGVFAVGAYAAARAARRRDPRRPETRREARRRAKLPAAEQVRPSDLPKAVRGDWGRLIEARRLVADLTADGWIDVDARAQVDEDVAHLGRLLVADRRTSEMGGRSNTTLQAQVGELADLMVALADEAVELQATTRRGRPAPATLTEAHDRLVSLRQAREVVERIDAASPAPDAAPGSRPRAAPRADDDERTQPPPPRPQPG